MVPMHAVISYSQLGAGLSYVDLTNQIQDPKSKALLISPTWHNRLGVHVEGYGVIMARHHLCKDIQ